MKAVTLDSPGQFDISVLPDIEPGPGEVLIEPLAVGLDGTDVAISTGKWAAHPGLVIGHEIAARVIACADDVAGPRISELVSVDPHIVCGRCAHCCAGTPQLCVNKRTFGIHMNGGLAQQMVVPLRNCLPCGVLADPVLIAMAEPLAVAIHALDVVEIPCASRVLVIGAGPIGLLIGTLIKGLPISSFSIIEKNERRQESARQLGARVIGSPQDVDTGAYDVVIEAVGKPETFETGLRCLAPGGVVGAVGVGGRGDFGRINLWDLFAKEIRVVGVRSGVNAQRRALELLPGLDLTALEMTRYEAGGVAQAISDIGDCRVGKAIVVLDDLRGN